MRYVPLFFLVAVMVFGIPACVAPSPSRPPRVDPLVPSDLEKLDPSLVERVQASSMIIVGRIVNIYPATDDPDIITPVVPRISEHDPQWMKVCVLTLAVLKGEKLLFQKEREDGVVFFDFPASSDVAWYLYPKFRVGDRGIFILHTEWWCDGTAVLCKLCARRKEDFRPFADIDLIRAALSQ